MPVSGRGRIIAARGRGESAQGLFVAFRAVLVLVGQFFGMPSFVADPTLCGCPRGHDRRTHIASGHRRTLWGTGR